MTKRKQLFSIMGIFAILGALALFTLPFNVESTTTTPALYGTNVPTADSTNNNVSADVIGNKSDAAAAGAVTTTESLMAYAKQAVGEQIALDTVADAILVDTAVIGALGVGLSDLGGMSTAMKAEVNVEADLALNTAVPDTPTGNSLNDVLSKLDGANTFDNTTDSLEAIRDIIDTNNTADQVDLDAILADSITISGGTLPAGPTSGSLATFVSGGSVGLGQPLPASTSLIDIIGNFTGPYGGAAQDDNIKASLDLLNTDSAITVADTPYIADLAIVTPVADSLASFIVSGGTAAGQNLPTSTSIVDIIGDFTGPYDGAAQDDNIKASLDLVNTDTAIITATTVSADSPNYFVVTADMTSATWNTAAAHEIAEVTGAVRMQVMIETVATIVTVGTNGTLALGFAGNTAAIIAATALDAALTGDVWTAIYAGVATTEIAGAEAGGSITHAIQDFVVVAGIDVGYTIATNAGTTGSLKFHVWWTPLDATGAVTAGAGGVL